MPGQCLCGRAAPELQRSGAILWRSHEALRGKRRGARAVAAADRTVPFGASGPSIMARLLADGAGAVCSGPAGKYHCACAGRYFLLPRRFGGYLFLESCRDREKLAASLQHPRWPAWQVFRSAVRRTCSWCEQFSCTTLARPQRPGLRKGLCSWPASSDLRTHSSLLMPGLRGSWLRQPVTSREEV